MEVDRLHTLGDLMEQTDGGVATVPSLASILAEIPDPRARRGQRDPWGALLLLITAALLSGANTQRAIARWGAHHGWRRLRRLGFTWSQAPSQATLHRLLVQVM